MNDKKQIFEYPSIVIITFSENDVVITGSIWQPDLDDLDLEPKKEKY